MQHHCPAFKACIAKTLQHGTLHPQSCNKNPYNYKPCSMETLQFAPAHNAIKSDVNKPANQRLLLQTGQPDMPGQQQDKDQPWQGMPNAPSHKPAVAQMETPSLHFSRYTIRFLMRAGFGGLSSWWQQGIGTV
jgi:hypothetical protein